MNVFAFKSAMLIFETTKHQEASQWGYAWVPVVAPICAGIVAVFLYKFLFMA